MVEKIWFKDIKHLFTEKNYSNFFPSKEMTFNEQLNSLVRFSIYFSIIIFILQKDSNIFMIPVFACIFTYFIYTVDDQNKTNEKLYLKDKNWYRDPRDVNDVCQLPSKDNPFMNVLISDYVLNPTKKSACNVSKNNIKRQAQKYFDRNLYRSVSDIFNKEASDRQWVTNPITTIPNDQDSFAKWCWGQGATCKEGNGNKCYSNIYRQVKT